MLRDPVWPSTNAHARLPARRTLRLACGLGRTRYLTGEILVSASWRGRLVVEPDELVDPDRPERQALVPGEGRQRRGAVNDHCAGHCVVSAAPGDDAPARRHDVAVPA